MVWPASRLCSMTKLDHDDFQSVKQYRFISPVCDQHDWTASPVPGPCPAAPHPGQSRMTTGPCAAPRDNAQLTAANRRSAPATRHAHSNPPGPLTKLCTSPLPPPHRIGAPNQPSTKPCPPDPGHPTSHRSDSSALHRPIIPPAQK